MASRFGVATGDRDVSSAKGTAATGQGFGVEKGESEMRVGDEKGDETGKVEESHVGITIEGGCVGGILREIGETLGDEVCDVVPLRNAGDGVSSVKAGAVDSTTALGLGVIGSITGAREGVCGATGAASGVGVGYGLLRR